MNKKNDYLIVFKAPNIISNELKKNLSLEKISQKNESFHSNRENSSSKQQSTSRNKQNPNQFISPSEEIPFKGDTYNNFNQFNQKPMNFFSLPNNPSYEMGYSMMYIMNFYEFHLNNMQNIIMQKNEEIMVI